MVILIVSYVHAMWHTEKQFAVVEEIELLQLKGSMLSYDGIC